MEKLIVKAKVKEFEINDPTQPFKIGNKLSFLSPIAEFQTQKPFRKPSDSSPQIPLIKPHNHSIALF